MTSTPSSSQSMKVDDKSENADGQQTSLALAFGKRLRSRADEMRYSRVDLQNALGVKKQTFAGYWNGERVPPSDILFAMSDKLDCDARWLATGEESGGTNRAALHDDIRRSQRRGQRAGEQDAETLDLVAVHEIDLAYGLGGTYSDGPVETQVLHFPRTWLESITSTPPSMLTFAKGRGDSMMPTVLDGDIVLIDRSQIGVREQDAIWALTVGDIAMIKRVRVRGETVMILSDNDRVPADEYHHEEITVIGRVVFIGRRI